MTTQVIVRTHDWPVAVISQGEHSYSDNLRRSHGYTSTTVFVPAHSEQTFTVSDTMAVSVRELPKDATGLVEPTTEVDQPEPDISRGLIAG